MNEEVKGYFKSLLNLPNMLTLFRLFCVPIFVLLFFLYMPNYFPALAVYVIASLTDAVDGFLARKLKQITPVGIVLDPLADKLLKTCTLFCFAYAQIIAWWFFGIMCFVDVCMILSGCILFKKHIQIPSNIIGKLGTLVTTIALLMCFFPQIFAPWNEYILYAGFGVVVSSVVLYVSLNYKKVFSEFNIFRKSAKNLEKNEENTENKE